MSQGQAKKRRALGRLMGCDPGLPADIAEALWRDPLALAAPGERLQHKPSCTVVRLDHDGGPIVWKRHAGSGLRKLRRAVTGCSPARKAWLDGWFLHEAGVPTPAPRAWLEQRIGPFRTASYFLADYVPGRSLYRLLRYERPSDAAVRDLARQTAAIWQRLDDLAVCHNDFKTENLLVDPQGKVWLIDVDRMLRFRSRPAMRQRQKRDAADLLHERNWRSDPRAAEVFREEILRTAAGRDAAGSASGEHPLNRERPGINPASHLVTAVVPCRNAAGSILGCLASLRDVVDEIVVASAGTSDETLRLVRQFGGCRIVHGRAATDAAFESWAVRQATHPWVLRILPHEQLNPELGRQIQDVAASDPDEDGFRVLRANYLDGRRLNHGGLPGDAGVRLFRREYGRFAMRSGEAAADVPGRKVGRLASRLIVETGREENEADPGAQAASGGWQAAWLFLKNFVLRRGFLDGRAGLAAAQLSARAAVRAASAENGGEPRHVIPMPAGKRADHRSRRAA